MEDTVQSTNTKPTSQKDFTTDYWFNALQMVTVVNPKAEDWPFMVEMRNFIIKAGATEKFPGVIANVYLDQMSKILAQDDDKLGFMTDPELRKIYYDKLIVSVEEQVKEYNPQPAYLKNVPETALAPKRDDTPPWDSSQGERARDIPPSPKVPDISPEALKEVKAEIKEFELKGAKYKMVIDKNGDSMFFKNGRRTSEAEYAKSASMV